MGEQMAADEQGKEASRAIARFSAATFAFMGQVIAVIGVVIVVLFPDLMRPVLGEDSRTVDGVLFAMLIGVLFSGLGLARWFHGVKRDIDDIEKNLRMANDGSVVWGQLLRSPAGEPTVEAVRKVTGIEYSTWTRRGAWAEMAIEELSRSAEDLGRRADEVRRGIIRVAKEDWNHLLTLVEEWAGIMRATSVQNVDGKDFWRSNNERDTYLLAQYDALQRRNLKAIQRAYVITSDMQQFLRADSRERREFLETTVLNELIGVEVRFVEADDVEDYILFEPDPRRRKTQTESLLYYFTRSGKETTTISCDATEVKQRSGEYAEVWARADRAEQFYRNHGLAEIVAQIKAENPLQSLLAARQ